LAGEFICHTDHGGLGDRVMLDKGGLNLGSRQTVTADVDDVVNSSSDPVETLVVSASAIASEL
jgi:hypothetical protein